MTVISGATPHPQASACILDENRDLLCEFSKADAGKLIEGLISDL